MSPRSAFDAAPRHCHRRRSPRTADIAVGVEDVLVLVGKHVHQVPTAAETRLVPVAVGRHRLHRCDLRHRSHISGLSRRTASGITFDAFEHHIVEVDRVGCAWPRQTSRSGWRVPEADEDRVVAAGRQHLRACRRRRLVERAADFDGLVTDDLLPGPAGVGRVVHERQDRRTRSPIPAASERRGQLDLRRLDLVQLQRPPELAGAVEPLVAVLVGTETVGIDRGDELAPCRSLYHARR